MSLDKELTKVDGNGKNTAIISCTFCPSLMLNPGTVTLVNQEFALPQMTRKGQNESFEREAITECWLVDRILTFDNILVSQIADNVKYLACADCEIGPVGWQDISTEKSYIALSRVKHTFPETPDEIQKIA